MRGEEIEKEGEEIIMTNSPSPTAALSKLAVPKLDRAEAHTRPAGLFDPHLPRCLGRDL